MDLLRPLRALLISCLVGLTMVVCAGPATALPAVPTAGNTKPIDWTIRFTFIGPNGEDAPLRVGQHDDGPLRGFGEDHMVDRHGEIPHPAHIKQAMRSPIRPCTYQKPNDTWECIGGAPERASDIVVIFTEREDVRSGDGRPVGVITSYYVSR